MREDWRDRCDHCGWPLKKTLAEGCTVGNCSMRPMPKLDDEGELRQLVRRLEADNQWLKHKLGVARVAIASEIEVSNCTWEFVDRITLDSPEDKEVLLSMVCVPGLKDANRLLAETPDTAPRLGVEHTPARETDG